MPPCLPDAAGRGDDGLAVSRKALDAVGHERETLGVASHQ
jgi:hypothetical protein